jgi:large subunit ribosomal protein L15
MTLALHSLAPAKGARRKKFRLGRGNASGRGTTAGRGTKGQRARTGGRKNLKLKGMKQMLLAFPKLRGFKSRYQKPAAVTLTRIAKAFASGERVDLKALKAKRLVTKTSASAKLVGTGTLDKPLHFVNIRATAAAKAAVDKAGGSLKTEKR